MRMLIQMSCRTINNRIKIQGKLEVVPIEGKIRSSSGLVMYKVGPQTQQLQELIVQKTVRGRGRPRKTWLETIGNDLKAFNLMNKIPLNRTEWKVDSSNLPKLIWINA